jgi:methionyl-tRNA formyltransferase
MSKTVAVLGKGELAIHVCQTLLYNQYYLSAIVPVYPEPHWTKPLSVWAISNKINIVNRHYDIPKNTDLVISVFYDKILKQDFISSFNKVINIHNGPLPKYRGVSPINWALKNNEIEHGITIHEITSGIDNGPIISQLKYSIYPEFDEVIDVYDRAISYGKVLFDQTLPILDKIIPRTQDNKYTSYYTSKQNGLLKERRYFTKNEST